MPLQPPPKPNPLGLGPSTSPAVFEGMAILLLSVFTGLIAIELLIMFFGLIFSGHIVGDGVNPVTTFGIPMLLAVVGGICAGGMLAMRKWSALGLAIVFLVFIFDSSARFNLSSVYIIIIGVLTAGLYVERWKQLK